LLCGLLIVCFKNRLPHFTTHGTVHIIVNNQVGKKLKTNMNKTNMNKTNMNKKQTNINTIRFYNNTGSWKIFSIFRRHCKND